MGDKLAIALMLFEAQGLHTTPVSVDPQAPDGSARAFKEVVGRWTGR